MTIRKNLSRRDFLRLSATAATGAIMAACAPATPGVVEVEKEVEVTREVQVETEVEKLVTSTPGAAPDPVTVNYWAHVTHPPRVKLDKVYIEQFTENNPHITVVNETPGDWDSKLLTSLAADVGPDLFAQWNAFTATFFYQGTIVPVDYSAFGMDKAEFMDLYLEPENTLQGCMFEGELYGIPNELSNYCFFTNNALWEEAGLDPENDVPDTWEDLIPVAEKMCKRDSSGNLVQRGYVLAWERPSWQFLTWGAMLRQLGGSELSEDGRTCTIDSPEAAENTNYWKQWIDLGLDGPQYTGNRAAVLNGTIASWSDTGFWLRDGLLEAGIEYTVHPVPRFKNAVNNNGFDNYAYFHMVNSAADPAVQQAAWQLAFYLDSFPVRYLENASLLQPRKEVEQAEEFHSIPYLDVFLNESKVSMYSPRTPAFNEVADALLRTRDLTCVQGMPAEEALAIGKEEIDKILDQTFADLEA
ncbi:MAG: extracellular solute-binding protein [Chloroflexi bacterium]|nr:extracellular solute-binding protein [Chloroflexota bacterium]